MSKDDERVVKALEDRKHYLDAAEFWQKWLNSFLNEEQQQHLLAAAKAEVASAQQRSSLTGPGSSGMWAGGSRKADDVSTPLLKAGAQQEKPSSCVVM